MELESLLSDPPVSATIRSILDACLLAQTNADEDLVPGHGATRGVFGYVGHFYRKHEVERLDGDAIPGFKIHKNEQRIEVAREDLRVMVVGLGHRPSQDPRSWMPQNQEGWPPTELRQGDLLSAEGVPLRGDVVFVCCILDGDGALESVELRAPRIDETGLLFAWNDIEEIWSADEGDDDPGEEEESVEVEVRRRRKKRRGDEGESEEQVH